MLFREGARRLMEEETVGRDFLSAKELGLLG